jgi:hypothetical protein
MSIADRIARGKARGLHILIASQSDGNLNADEIGVLTVYELAGDKDVREFLHRHPNALDNSEFLKTISGRALVAMLKVQIDRLLVMVLVTVLCLWDLLSSTLRLTDAQVTTWMPSAQILCPAIIATAMGFVLPAAFFAGSKLVFIAVEDYMKQRFDSIAVNMNRMAEKLQPPAASPASPTS